MDKATTDKNVRIGVAALVLVALQIAVLHHFGQPFLAASGQIKLWANDPLSPDMSQQLADWYSFSHLIHGAVFYGLLHLLAPRLPVGVRLLIAMGIEIAWEITENTPAVIQHYRQQALAAGYVGDSILNSVSDTVMMSTGFFAASRLRARYTVAIALAFELFTAFMIRDNLTLNVLNLIAPSDWAPIQAIHHWQEGARQPRWHTGTILGAPPLSVRQKRGKPCALDAFG
ncbi:MAG TPA: DUF2585 family protein [Rhizomicrobium sp.]|jgi:hypothetical protein|nr:DUF2585 family protein [Rhizomicrobium sp.]